MRAAPAVYNSEVNENSLTRRIGSKNPPSSCRPSPYGGGGVLLGHVQPSTVSLIRVTSSVFDNNLPVTVIPAVSEILA